MAVGGGTFLTQNKILPGTYINFVAANRGAVTLSDRGYVTMALPLCWGPVGEMMEVTGNDLLRRSRELFGREYTHDDLRPLRELFSGARVAYLWRLGAGGQTADSSLGRARFPGALGNEISIVVSNEGEGFGVETLVDGTRVDYQLVENVDALVDNAFVLFHRTGQLHAAAGVHLSGGTDGSVQADEYSRYLDASERYAFNIMGCMTEEETIKGMFARHVKRMREEVGAKFQCVLHQYTKADYEGVISVENRAAEEPAGLVYWVAGNSAGCPINRSLTNRRYNGEFTVDTNFTHRQLEQKLRGGSFLFAGGTRGDVRVVEDVNSLQTFNAERGADFTMNQTMRVLDQVARDIANLFVSRYLGVVPNDNAGRLALWSDIVSHHRQLEQIRAIEDFEPQDVIVEMGETKRAVVVTDRITPVNAMSQLYMTVIVQ